MARGLCFKCARHDRQARPVEPVPARRRLRPVAGPGAEAPVQPKNRFHYNWHWFWDTGNGDLGNQGIHEVDIARWGLGVTHPTKVSAIGGKFMFDDDQETPNTLNARFEFDVERQEEDDDVRGAPLDAATTKPASTARSPATRSATQFYGSEGLPGHRQLQQVLHASWARTRSPGRPATERDEHFANFIDAVRSRKREDLNAEIEEGALSCVPDAPGQHQLSRRPHAALGREDHDVRRRPGSERDADARLSRAVRRAWKGVMRMRRAALLWVLALAACRSDPYPVLALGARAPDFSLPGADGRAHALGDYAGSPVLAIVFMCNHCPAAQLYRAAGSEAVRGLSRKRARAGRGQPGQSRCASRERSGVQRRRRHRRGHEDARRLSPAWVSLPGRRPDAIRVAGVRGHRNAGDLRVRPRSPAAVRRPHRRQCTGGAGQESRRSQRDRCTACGPARAHRADGPLGLRAHVARAFDRRRRREGREPGHRRDGGRGHA